MCKGGWKLAAPADLPRLPRPADPERERRVRRTVLAATWGPWALTAVVVLTVWAAVALGGGGGYFWPIWVIGPWGAVLALGHAHRSLGRRSVRAGENRRGTGTPGTCPVVT